MKNDLCVLFGEKIGSSLAFYIEENQVVNPQSLWGFIREQVEKCKYLDDSIIDQLIAVPPNSWEELKVYGRFQRRYSDLIWGYNAFENEPPELFELYEVFLIAEEALMLRSKFKKARTSKQPKTYPYSVCIYCWRETENSEVCELHLHGTAARKRADRANKHYLDILAKLKLELARNKRKRKVNQNQENADEEKEIYIYLKKWAQSNHVEFSDKPKLLESLDGRGVSYNLEALKVKQERLLNGLRISDKKAQLLLDAVLLRAEAFLRAEDVVRRKKRNDV